MKDFRIGDEVVVTGLYPEWQNHVKSLEGYLGKHGVVNAVDRHREGGVQIQIPGELRNWWFHPDGLTKADELLAVGDKVVVNQPIGEKVYMNGAKNSKNTFFREQTILEIVAVRNEPVPPHDENNFIGPVYLVQNPRGQRYTIYRNYLSKVQLVEIEAKKEFAIGDRVYVPNRIIPKRSVHWANPEMDEMIGIELIVNAKQRMPDGMAYNLHEVGDLPDDGWWFHEDWIKPWGDGKGMKKVIKPKKEKKATKRDLEKAITEARKILSGVNGGTCNYIVIEKFKKPEQYKLRKQIADVCHARMGGNAWNEKAGQPFVMVDWIADFFKARDKKDHEMFKDFVKYVMLESPAAGSWITKRPQDAFRYGLVIDNTKTVTQLAFATFMMRMGREYSNRLPIFHMLRKEGFSGHVAFLLTFSFTPVGSTFQYAGMQGHSCINEYHKPADLVNLFSGKKKFPEGDAYHVNASGWRVFDATGPLQYQGDSFQNWIHRQMEVDAAPRKFGEKAKGFGKDDLIKIAKNLQKLFDEVK